MVGVAMRRELQALLATHPFLADLDQALLARHGVHVSLERGATLYTSGRHADAVHFLLRGALQIEYPEKRAARGRVITIVTAPGVLGECQTLYGRPWTGTGVAVTELDALVLDGESFWQLLSREPRLTKRLYCELAWQFLGAIDRRRVEPAHDPATRLRNYLVDLHRVFAEIDPSFSGWIPALQRDLARACELRRETVVRIVAQWRKSGAIDSRRGCLRLHPRLLRAASGPSLISRLSELAAKG